MSSSSTSIRDRGTRAPHSVVRPAVRLVIALVVATAVIATFMDTASRTAINPFNFFGFFTMQSNIMAALVILTAVVLELAKRPRPSWYGWRSGIGMGKLGPTRRFSRLRSSRLGTHDGSSSPPLHNHRTDPDLSAHVVRRRTHSRRHRWVGALSFS